ncbi:hypothetical protein ACFQU7_01070 [Pseudoroseomonas wenyumeiae]
MRAPPESCDVAWKVKETSCSSAGSAQFSEACVPSLPSAGRAGPGAAGVGFGGTVALGGGGATAGCDAMAAAGRSRATARSRSSTMAMACTLRGLSPFSAWHSAERRARAVKSGFDHCSSGRPREHPHRPAHDP